MKILNRDELQGVIAHEIGHVRNRDILLMLFAGVLMGAIVLLADVGLRVVVLGRRAFAPVQRRRRRQTPSSWWSPSC